ncbi:hypothetical protein P3T76_012249 [Phytophthora citrophthora]|uniref:Uncharacterized protein n=1 Tax=Phytophthora citrophthora TaxID=4793 RepID=A0AAD9LDC1_9STRA|nr:hypothetical protein P3T76_012249 [Phytophthora citrophthora]
MSTYAYFHGVNRTVRHNRTVEWLKQPGGDWRNGWYEGKEGGRWYSEVLSSAPGDPYNVMHRVFDMTTGKELDCSNPDSCEAPRYSESWGNKFQVISGVRRVSSVNIANATEFGLFTYECYRFSEVKSVFDWETLLANVYTVWILHRWVLAQFLILSSGLNRKNQHFGGGINLVSSSKNFRILPIVSLPRLRMTLIAFWTVGCSFEGQQQALAEAWFAIYPAIAHFVLIYFSLLDLLGKILRRRVSDVLFGPAIFILCLLHYCRQPLASSGWLQDVDGRVATVVFSDEVDEIQLADFITSDIAWRLNGRVSFVYSFKWCLLGINLLPLLVSRSLPILPRGNSELNGLEKALALSVRNVGGLGTSPPYILMAVGGILSSSSDLRPRKSQTEVVPFLDEHEMRQKSDGGQRQVILVSNFELIRLGYVIFGDRYLTTFQEWGRMTAMTPFRAIFHLWNHRMFVWTLRPLSTNGDAEIAGGRALECTEPQLWRLDDPRLQHFKWWQVSACTIQC